MYLHTLDRVPFDYSILTGNAAFTSLELVMRVAIDNQYYDKYRSTIKLLLPAPCAQHAQGGPSKCGHTLTNSINLQGNLEIFTEILESLF